MRKTSVQSYGSEPTVYVKRGLEKSVQRASHNDLVLGGVKAGSEERLDKVWQVIGKDTS